MITFLQGKKSYIVAILVGLITTALYLGWITQEVANILYGLLGAAGLASMRAAIK